MDTLGLWLGPTLAVIATAAVTRWLGWFQPRWRRRVALRRIAERLASEDSSGYDYKYDRFLEHYLGGRDWREEWGKADTSDGNRGFYDSRGGRTCRRNDGPHGRTQVRGRHLLSWVRAGHDRNRLV